MDLNKRISERVAVLASISPISGNNTTKASSWVKCDKVGRLMALISVGVTDCLVDAVIQSATDSGGTNAATVKAITQYSATDDGKIATMDCRPQEATPVAGVDALYFRILITISNATAAVVSAELLGADFRYDPTSVYDATNVKEHIA